MGKKYSRWPRVVTAAMGARDRGAVRYSAVWARRVWKLPRRTSRAAAGRNAVLIDGNGALIFGNNDGDMQALEIIMDKGCEAAVDVNLFNREHYVPKIECFLMRTVYLAKYSKQINK